MEEKTIRKINIIKEIAMIALSFIVTLVLLIILMNSNHISLGGYKNLTIMMIDMQSEYICYMRDLRQILLHGGSFIYTAEKVFGGDYLSIFTFYLASPFNLFVVFFKEEAIPLFFVWSSIIKMAFASLNFYLLVRLTGKFTYQKIIFAIGYGFVSYSFIYMSNYMWLDGVMILPLVALGIHLIKAKKHYWVYSLAIAYSLMTSWYIGFMVCMFSVLYFHYVYVKHFSVKNKPSELAAFPIRYAIFSLVGGLLSVTYWFVAFMHLSGTKAFSEIPPNKFFSISMLLSGFLENNYAQANLIRQYHSYISMFVGVVPLVFAITFFFNGKYTTREKIALAILFTFYMVMSSNRITAALLHGGKEPTWFPGRYSFIIGFIVCYIASLSADEAEKLHPAFYSVPTVVGIAVLLVVKYTHHSEFMERYPISVPSAVMYFVSIGFAFVISLVNILPIKKLDDWKIKLYLPHALVLLVIVQGFSIYRGGDKVLKVNADENQFQTYETYLKDDAYTSAFNVIKQYDKNKYNSAFYRMESTFNRPGNYNQIDNNPMFYSYSGLSNFSSSSKKEVESYMSKVGYHYNGFFSKFQAGSTYSITSLLGIKYILENPAEYKNYHPYYLDYNTFQKLAMTEKDVNFYYNPNAVNLGFVSDKTSSYFINEGYRSELGNMYWFDHFEYQNTIFKTMHSEINEDIFKPLTVTKVTTSPSLEYDEDEFGIRTYKEIKKYDSIRIEFTVPSEGTSYPLYFSEKNYYKNANFYIDGRSYPINTYWNKGIFSFPDTANHKHTLNITFTEGTQNVSIRPELYYEDLSVMQKYFDKIKEQEFVVDKVKNSATKKSFVGHIDIKDNNKHLVFTIPHESGISVYVDGKKAKTMTKYNIFTAIDLSSYSTGTHKVTIQYQDKYLSISLPIFFVSIGGFVPLVLFYTKIEESIVNRIKNHKKKKEE